MDRIKPGIYQHYRKKRYKVIGLVKHTETEEDLVLYQSLQEDGIWWVRPLKMFLEKIEVKGKKISRYKYVSEK